MRKVYSGALSGGDIFRNNDGGKIIWAVLLKHGVSKATIFNWKSKYGGMQMNELKRVKELEQENRKRKHMYADLALDNEMLKDILEKV
ncbi:MAG: transposase [Chryseolinea sp.]